MPKRQEQSLPVPFGPHCASRRDSGIHPSTFVKPLSQFAQGRPFGRALHFPQQEIGEGHPFQRCLRLEPAMEVVRDVSDLDHA